MTILDLYCVVARLSVVSAAFRGMTVRAGVSTAAAGNLAVSARWASLPKGNNRSKHKRVKMVFIASRYSSTWSLFSGKNRAFACAMLGSLAMEPIRAFAERRRKGDTFVAQNATKERCCAGWRLAAVPKWHSADCMQGLADCKPFGEWRLIGEVRVVAGVTFAERRLD